MKDIILMKNGEEVKRFKVRDAFMADGFRVLIDDYRTGKKNGVIVADDGKSDRIFATEEAAVQRVIKYADACLKIAYIDSFNIVDKM